MNAREADAMDATQPTTETSSAGRLPIAVLVSGSGSTLGALADAAERGELDASIELVVASRPDAYGLERARARGIPHRTVSRKAHGDTESFSEAIFGAVRASGARLVCMAGFLSLLAIPEDYEHRVINVHPALLPSFGGPGMYGRRVHEAVLEAGCKVSGCTIHFADQSYDTGPILVQRCCRVAEDDTPETLAERVRAEERAGYVEAINLVAAGRVRIEAGRARIDPAEA